MSSLPPRPWNSFPSFASNPKKMVTSVSLRRQDQPVIPQEKFIGRATVPPEGRNTAQRERPSAKFLQEHEQHPECLLVTEWQSFLSGSGRIFLHLHHVPPSPFSKKYKKLFKQVEDFDRLIDLHHSLPNSTSEQQPKRSRKRSFTLP
jgi:hypothetical protein